MAKIMVKCLYCRQMFDRNDSTIPFVKPKANRYAHQKCFEERDKLVSKEQQEKDKFYQYCKELFGSKFDFVKINKMAEGYIKKYGYSYSGMLKTLVYFYEVKKESVEKANGNIGIIPYTYQQAYDYYFGIWQAQQLNIDKKIEDYVPEVIEVTIPPPKPNPKRRKLFKFLDEMEEDD